jgi:hypothetical protein
VSDPKIPDRDCEAACWALLGLDMPDVVYQTIDGLQVTLTERRWLTHILPRHGEVTEADVAQALTAAVCVYQHRTDPMQRVYQGRPRLAGFFRGLFPLVVVVITGKDTGAVVTAYLTTLPYRGVQRWP